MVNLIFIINEDIDKIKNFTKDVKDTTKTVRSVNDLNIAIRDFEHSAFEIEKENHSLRNKIEEKDTDDENEIANNIARKVKTKENIDTSKTKKKK